MQQIVKILHSKCALGIIKSTGSESKDVWIQDARKFTFHGVKWLVEDCRRVEDRCHFERISTSNKCGKNGPRARFDKSCPD